MTNQDYIEYATDKWMELFKKKSTLSKQDIDKMETLITYIIEGTLQFKEQQAVEWLESVNLDYYQIREGVFSKELVDDFRKAMKGE